VATEVFRIPFSIGYIEQAYSKGLLLPFAAIRNQAGNYVIPSAQTVAAQKTGHRPAGFSIVNQPGASSYPISGYSWALVYTHQTSQATGRPWSPCWTGSPTTARPTPLPELSARDRRCPAAWQQ
jgi:phosphate transport system substrate-binding protein